MKARKPVVALVGRPNVGKSTLFNKLTGTRTAIVEDVAGTTRDRIYGDSDWNGKGFIVVDTGGLEAPSMMGGRRTRQHKGDKLAENSADFVPQIQNQARLALDEADVIILVVDGMSGHSMADTEVADILRTSNVPIFVAVNKAESQKRQLDAVEFWSLGLGEPIPISAYHGDGVGDLLDEVAKVLPPYPVDEPESDSLGIALVGRPNVGKSSLLNNLVGIERSIVSDIPGTTRDPIDTEITYHGQQLILIDTAGIRRRGSIERGIEKYSVLRSMRSIDRADVALLLIDAAEGVTAQDQHVAGYVLERRKGVVVLVNKWDLVEKDSFTMVQYAAEVRDQLKFMDYVPVHFISALTKQRIHQIIPEALEVSKNRLHKIGTSAFNNILRDAYDRISPPSKNGRPLRLYYGTQTGTKPPTFTIFVNNPDMIHFSYERYLENRIREYYPFTGTPIRFFFRPRSSEEG